MLFFLQYWKQIAIVALVSLVIVQVNHWRVKAAKLDAAKQELSNLKEEVKRNDKITKDLQTRIRENQANGRKHRQLLSAELASGAGYDCPIAADGVQLLRDASTSYTR